MPARYAPILKFLTLVLFLYVAVVFTIQIPWRAALVGTGLPTISLNYDYLLLVVAVLGTTEEMRRERSRPQSPLKFLRGVANPN
jgi:hypothetical protein